jgi:aspartyl-tRNA(Asn)/glutamyl-tRNA(Gln) amidotransferase subunit C
MAISKEEIQHIADLARLQLSPEEIDKFRNDLSSILEYIDQLQEVDTTGVAPRKETTPVRSVFREDVAEPSLPIEKVLLNAPSVKDNMFSVPRVIDN